MEIREKICKWFQKKDEFVRLYSKEDLNALGQNFGGTENRENTGKIHQMDIGVWDYTNIDGSAGREAN